MVLIERDVPGIGCLKVRAPVLLVDLFECMTE